MKDVFFSATKNALENITETFDSVWPIAVGLWNLRCSVNEVKLDNPGITEKELALKYTEGSGIHGVNYKRSFFERTWEQQQSDFAWILLNSTFPIYEEWLAELKSSFFKSMNVRKMQLPYDIRNEVSRLTSNRSSVLENSFYSAYCSKRDRNYSNIEALMVCFRVFKEARNCYMHNGAKANQRMIDSYQEYIKKTSKTTLGVTEVPVFFQPTLNEEIQLSLRGVVGFSYILIKILVSLDTELLRSSDAERELINRFKEKHTILRTLKSDVQKAKIQVRQYIKQCSFPDPDSVEEVMHFLLNKHLIRSSTDKPNIST